MKTTLCLLSAVILCSCRSASSTKKPDSNRYDEQGRKIIAGPSNVQREDIRDQGGYNPNGGSGFMNRFESTDYGGYGSEGLNAMSLKMFNKKLGTKELKSFSQTKDFVSKRYGGSTRELEEKTSASARLKSWFSGKKASGLNSARDEQQAYRSGGKAYDAKTSRDNDREAVTGTFRDAEKSAVTRDYEEAASAQLQDMTPKMKDADPASSVAVSRFVRSRPSTEPATMEQIRQLLGK